MNWGCDQFVPRSYLSEIPSCLSPVPASDTSHLLPVRQSSQLVKLGGWSSHGNFFQTLHFRRCAWRQLYSCRHAGIVSLKLVRKKKENLNPTVQGADIPILSMHPSYSGLVWRI